MSPHLFEGLDPALRDELGPDTILVVGENFGTGSSREHVPLAMKASGVSCLVGISFARIFRRNCLNLGLPLVDCPDAVARAHDRRPRRGRFRRGRGHGGRRSVHQRADARVHADDARRRGPDPLAARRLRP